MREDSDRDGSRTICARDRDHEDQTFPSVCHMMCYNRCTEFHRKNQDGVDRVFIYRTSKINIHKDLIQNSQFNILTVHNLSDYYKLHDGPCPKRMKKI